MDMGTGWKSFLCGNKWLFQKSFMQLKKLSFQSQKNPKDLLQGHKT